MYKTLKEITDYADQLNMTVGAFNMHNLEMLPGMIRGGTGTWSANRDSN